MGSSWTGRTDTGTAFPMRGILPGDATMLWVKISKTDYSFTEGQWTLSNAYLMDGGTGNLVPSRSGM